MGELGQIPEMPGRMRRIYVYYLTAARRFFRYSLPPGVGV